MTPDDPADECVCGCARAVHTPTGCPECGGQHKSTCRGFRLAFTAGERAAAQAARRYQPPRPVHYRPRRRRG